MSEREKASEIQETATAWVTRAERGLTAVEQGELDRWLEGDSRRLGAFVRAQAVWIHAERAAALGKMPDHDSDTANYESSIEPQSSSNMTRRLLLGSGGAIVASVIAATAVRWPRYRTLESGVGETRHIALMGGTVLTLDTDTKVDIAAGSNDRSLILRRGKLFVQALGGGQLVSVGIGSLLMETTEGAFGIQSLLDEPVTALVTKGVLAVSQTAGLFEKARTLTVAEGQALTVGSHAQMSPNDIRSVAATRIAQFLAWKDGMLSFGGEALGDAVRSFDRYSAMRIVVDAALAQQRITGLFKADDPKGFATAIAASFGAMVSVRGDVIQLTSKKVPSR